MSHLRSRIITVVLSFSLVLLQGAPLSAASGPAAPATSLRLPPSSEQPQACVTLLRDLGVTTEVISGVSSALTITQNGLAALDTGISATLETNTAVNLTDDTVADMAKFFSQMGPLFEPVPNIQAGMERATEILRSAHETFLPIIRRGLGDMVTDLNLNVNQSKVKKAFDVVQSVNKVVGPLNTTATWTTRTTKVICAKLFWNAMPQSEAPVTSHRFWADDADPPSQAQTAAEAASCRAQAEGLMTPMDVAVAGLNRDLAALSGALGPLQAVMQDEIGPALKPVEAIQAPIAALSSAASDMHKASREFKGLLATKIKVDLAGYQVAEFSVEEILHDWDKVVKKMETELHVAQAKAWLRSELDRVMGGIAREVLAPVHAFEHSISAQLNPAQSAAARLEQQLAHVTGISDITAQLQIYNDKMTTLSNTCK